MTDPEVGQAETACPTLAYTLSAAGCAQGAR